MKQHLGTQARSTVQPLLCDHHFHVVHVAGRTISGVLVCESCGQRIVHRRKEEMTERRSEFAEREIGQL